jgi:hypothetical protein
MFLTQRRKEAEAERKNFTKGNMISPVILCFSASLR